MRAIRPRVVRIMR